MKTNVEKLKEILGEGGRYHVTRGPEGENMSEEEIAGVVLSSIERLLNDELEPIVEIGD